LERIGAIMEQRWDLEGEVGKEKSGDNAERFKDGPRESQEEGTLLSASCWISGLVFLYLIEFFIFSVN